MPGIVKKYQAVEGEWRQSHPSEGTPFEILTFIKKTVNRLAFKNMLEAAGQTEKMAIDVEMRTFAACAPQKPYKEPNTLRFSFSEGQTTRLDILHRLTHYSLGQTGYCGRDDHGVDFADRYLELVFRFHEDKQSASAKKAVKTLMVQNRIKTYVHSEESKLRRERRAKAEELRAQLAELRD